MIVCRGPRGQNKTIKVIDELQLSFFKGGITGKVFIVSGEDPPENLNNGEIFVVVEGLKCFPKGEC